MFVASLEKLDKICLITDTGLFPPANLAVCKVILKSFNH